VDVLRAAHAAASDGASVVIATLLDAPDAGRRALLAGDGSILAGSLPDDVLPAVRQAATDALAADRSGATDAAGRDVYLEVVAPRPRLVVLGAGPSAEPLVEIAVLCGFEVVVADPRPAFAEASRFPGAVEVLVGWPDDLEGRLEIDGRTFVVSLLHDERFEGPMLPMVLDSDARYIGAMGSRRTHAKRLERLAEQGHPDAGDRIHGPVGLDIGSETPAEIAVAIMAEVISIRRGAPA
jgi:xanthine dehydrogenase accessory factor